MKIPTYEEVHTTNNYFLWFTIYEFFDALVFIGKWFFILFFLYILFSTMGVELSTYISDVDTQQAVAHFNFSLSMHQK